MKHVKPMDCEKGKEFLCQVCDEPFLHPGEEKPACPKCGATGSKWLLLLPLQEDEDGQRREAGSEGIIVEESGLE